MEIIHILRNILHFIYILFRMPTTKYFLYFSCCKISGCIHTSDEWSSHEPFVLGWQCQKDRQSLVCIPRFYLLVWSTIETPCQGGS